MKTQFANAARCGTLLLVATLLAGCTKSLYGLLEPPHPKVVDFSEGYVWSECRKIIETSSKKSGEDDWVKLGVYEHMPSRVTNNLFTLGLRELTNKELNKGYVERRHMGKCHSSYWVGLQFSLIQLDGDTFSITSSHENRNNVDEYTLLVVAERGLHDGFKYARFESTESRDVTENVPLTTTTSGGSTDFSNLASLYGSTYGLGSTSSHSQSTTSGGYTKTLSYGRNHRIRYFNKPVEGAFNLETVARSIKKQDSNWEVRGLD